MSSAVLRDPYGAALGTVRHFALAGRFVPGEAIVVTDLAVEVGYSPTPVREALACLAGEGLIERRRGRGYFYPELSAAEAIDLFELQLAYLTAALTLYPRGMAPLRKAVAGLDPRLGHQAFFRAVIGQSGNAALSQAHERLTHRLGPVLRAEHAADLNDAVPVSRMIDDGVRGDLVSLMTQLERYHDLRCARVREQLSKERRQPRSVGP